MIFLISMWIGMLWGVIKWLTVIIEVMRNRCMDKDYKLGAIVSNVCYLIVIGFLVLLTKEFNLFITVYPILAFLGNTVFCICTTPVPEHTDHDDSTGNDDYGYINR